MTIIKLLLILFCHQPVEDIEIFTEPDHSKYYLVVDDYEEEISRPEAFLWYLLVETKLDEARFEEMKTPI